MTKRQECGILYVSAAECCWPTIALPEMTGFYNPFSYLPFPLITIALPETAGLWYIRTKKGPQDYALRLHNKNALDETAGMRYSVYVSGRMPLAYYSPAGNDRVL